MGKKVAGKLVMVLMESLSGSGHKFATLKPKGVEKLEAYRFDPMVRQWVIYREARKIRTIRS